MNRKLITRRNKEIYRSVMKDGEDIVAVARAFNLSRRSIYNILGKFKKKGKHEAA